jgi:hypothetical protein
LKYRDVARDRLNANLATKLWSLFMEGNVAAGKEFRKFLEVNDRMELESAMGSQPPSTGKAPSERVGKKALLHAPSSLMDWCVGNVKIEPTATAIRATKQNAGDAKIDPWAALMNGVWMMSRNPEANGTSGWNTDDLDGLIAKIDAVVDAMGETGDADSGRQVLQGVGRPA